MAVVRPDLFTYRKGVVRVETQGICIGHTLMDQGLKRWNTSNHGLDNRLWQLLHFIDTTRINSR
ncbi:unnamed protein product, partial [Linum tenue]